MTRRKPEDEELARAAFLAFLEDLPQPTPRWIFERLGEMGYVGQETGRRAMALMAHRHVRRIRALHLHDVPRDALPPKENHLLVGPTGCGKTFLVELLFREILHLPTALVDITTFSETGYIGNDVSTILTRLLFAAGGDLLKAQVGLVCLDEFDKIASGQNRAVFSGAGTTKDVTGLGVQRELLKLLERGETPVPTAFDHNTYQPRVLLRTDDIAFVAAGAFSGLKSVSRWEQGRTSMGFCATGVGEGRESIAVRYEPDELEDTTVFQTYGFLPELIGRFSRIIPFHPLDDVTLRTILAQQVIPARQKEMALAGMALVVEDEVLAFLVGQARKKQTGARGLASSLTRHLEDAAYEAYSSEHVRGVRVAMNGERVETRLE